MSGTTLRPLQALLAAQEVVILDGGLATELERRGADLNDPLWSARVLIERPELIRSVHADYFAAGADVAITATYQATVEGFARRGIGPAAAARTLRAAVDLATEARDSFWSDATNRKSRRRPLVAASIGPYGAMLADGSEYRGHYAIDDRELENFHRPRLALLAASGADVLACETLPCLREALILARLLAEHPAMSAWIAFSCSDGRHDCEGEDIGECAAALQPFPQIAAIGINCTRPEHVASLLRRMRASTDRPLIAYPNSGEIYAAGSKSWAGQPQDQTFAVQSSSWYEAGARLLGGCCRTTPQDIAELRARYAPIMVAPPG